ncbi:MAG: STAS domain-containing protein [Candidatus Eisenbacteria bacterium]|nr:STAS domain-containing protein [Candidatus Eisenbacteria bacterium]
MTIRQVGDITVVSPTGWLVGGEETDRLEDQVRELLANGNRRLVIDLGGIAMMNSLAVGALMGCRQSYRNRDCHMVLCGLNTRLARMFLITQLTLVFELHETLEAALAALQQTA